MQTLSARFVLALALFLGIAANADDASTLALRLFSRVAGVKASMNDPRIAQMASLISAGQSFEAADIATRDSNFLNVTAFQFFAPKSMRTEVTNSGFNDFIAMGMLVTRDDKPYTDMVQGDFTVTVNGVTAGLTGTAPNLSTNVHYTTAQTSIANLGASLKLVTPQRPSFPDAAGALTSWQFMEEHANMGTNRRIVQFAFQEFLCTPITAWRDSDATLSDDVITRDVDRSPGGDPVAFQTQCRVCHQVLDPLRAAFAFHDFSGNTPVYKATPVKLLINATVNYPDGAILGNDSWQNRATLNQNSQFGWQGALSGSGAKGFGQMIARSDRFASCAVQQVFQQICLRAPNSSEMSVEISSIAKQFKSDNYNLRNVFKRVSTLPQCMGSL
ncbi:MAG: hypothetical protein HYR96_03410 [Deltaproteobacteria bacterium]|nr:hypothetical protein [Deltaproteobacteria bacterium]MBI3294270.1 hypothetical protein [Deltaproteobacteria bacterium]